MMLRFLGATRTVTGSCYLLRFGKHQVLVDCGLFQGSKDIEENNYLGFHYNPGDIDYVLLTHAHIDHSGLIPRLCRLGFKGEVISTHGTKDLCKIMLPDSGYLQEEAARHVSKRRTRKGRQPRPPLYTREDAEDCIRYFRSVDYDKEIALDDDLTVRFRDAGHILGSSFIDAWAREDGHEVQLLFSGDLGQPEQPIIRDPVLPKDSSPDYMLIESTYGDKLHDKQLDCQAQLVEAINTSMIDGGKMIIPAFSVGRTQNLIYYLNEALNEKKIEQLPVYVDSPLAINALDIYASHPECFDEQTMEFLKTGDLPLDFPGLKMTRSPQESKAINDDDRPGIIISASGMCTGGRVRHHLKHNIWKREATVLFVSYQAEHTLGRQIVDGQKVVKILGEEYRVAARIMKISGFSAHADRQQLLSWSSELGGRPKRTFVVHGDLPNSQALAKELRKQLKHDAYIPRPFETVKLTEKKD
jgi:metallo-beta-lactamase family protein